MWIISTLEAGGLKTVLVMSDLKLVYGQEIMILTNDPLYGKSGCVTVTQVFKDEYFALVDRLNDMHQEYASLGSIQGINAPKSK